MTRQDEGKRNRGGPFLAVMGGASNGRSSKTTEVVENRVLEPLPSANGASALRLGGTLNGLISTISGAVGNVGCGGNCVPSWAAGRSAYVRRFRPFAGPAMEPQAFDVKPT